MLMRLQQHAVPITIVVAFYVFGFFVMVHALGLSDPQIAAGLISGAIGGLTTLAIILRTAWHGESLIAHTH